MATIKLPAYVRPKPLAGGRIGYFWELPTWAKPPVERHGKRCPIVSTPLGCDPAKAITAGEAINDAFRGWRKGEGVKLVQGSVRWLFVWFRKHEKFLRLDAKTRADYVNMMSLVAAVPMKAGGTFGDRAVSKVDAAVADRLHAKLKPRGERQATYAMQVCRLIWNRAGRATAQTGIQHRQNPFAAMGLSSKAAQGNRETSRAEYDRYRKAARDLGYQSMASAAALGFELAPRVWDVFGYEDEDGEKARGIMWVGYRPGVSLTYKQSKTGKTIVIPLLGRVRQSDGSYKVEALYPDLEEELARTPRRNDLIVVEERSGEPYKKRRMSAVHRQICDAAGLPKEMKFTGFRHGAATEMGDAGQTDMRPITGHSEISTTTIYNKANEEKARRIGGARRAHVVEMSERAVGIASERAGIE